MKKTRQKKVLKKKNINKKHIISKKGKHPKIPFLSPPWVNNKRNYTPTLLLFTQLHPITNSKIYLKKKIKLHKKKIKK